MWSAASLVRALGIPETPAPAATPAPATTTPAKTASDRPVGELERWQVRSAGMKRSDVRLAALREGSHVTAGTVLGHTGSTTMRFAVRPAGSGAPRIDPRPILDGWERYDETAVTDETKTGTSKLASASATTSDADVGALLLLSKAQLQARVLANPRLQIYEAGRNDVRSGQIDRRVLATLEYLSADGTTLTITSLRSGHSVLSASGNVSAHSYGSAVDIAAVNGTSIMGHQGAGSITETTIRRILRLQGAAAPNQIISLMTFAGAPTTMSMADHADHIHVGFPRAGTDVDGTLGAQVAATLKPSQWPELVARLGAIDNPDVSAKVSKAATDAADSAEDDDEG
jgi:hypothetical protein